MAGFISERRNLAKSQIIDKCPKINPFRAVVMNPWILISHSPPAHRSKAFNPRLGLHLVSIAYQKSIKPSKHMCKRSLWASPRSRLHRTAPVDKGLESTIWWNLQSLARHEPGHGQHRNTHLDRHLCPGCCTPLRPSAHALFAMLL